MNVSFVTFNSDPLSHWYSAGRLEITEDGLRNEKLAPYWIEKANRNCLSNGAAQIEARSIILSRIKIFCNRFLLLMGEDLKVYSAIKNPQIDKTIVVYHSIFQSVIQNIDTYQTRSEIHFGVFQQVIDKTYGQPLRKALKNIVLLTEDLEKALQKVAQIAEQAETNIADLIKKGDSWGPAFRLVSRPEKLPEKLLRPSGSEIAGKSVAEVGQMIQCIHTQKTLELKMQFYSVFCLNVLRSLHDMETGMYSYLRKQIPRSVDSSFQRSPREIIARQK